MSKTTYEPGQRVSIFTRSGGEIARGHVYAGDNYPASNERTTWSRVMRTTMANLYTTLPLNPNNGWQVTRELTGFYGQHKVTGPHAWAVRTTYGYGDHDTGIAPTIMHGPWDEAKARRFACSMGNGERSQPIAVEPYYYCEAWGVVPAASVHTLDLDNSKDWSIRPVAATTLGTQE
jgi:hypothetical protein